MGVFAVVLAVLAVLCGVFGTMFFGTAGVIATVVLAAAAVLLGFLKRKKAGRGGIPAFVIAGIALVLALSLSSVWSSAFKALHEKAVKYKPDGLWAQLSENTDGGLMGILSRLPDDEATLDALQKETNELNQITGN